MASTIDHTAPSDVPSDIPSEVPTGVPSQRAQRVRDLLDELEAGVAKLSTESAWREWLDIATRFHRYSWANTIAIWTQRPDATTVAGYQRWRSLGRQVRRGEHGIRILAALTYRAIDDNSGTGEDEVPQLTPRVRVLRGFKVVSVFDISQTDGDPLPQRPGVDLLEGDAPHRLRHQLTALIRAQHFEFALAPLPDHHGDANGLTHWGHRTVTVRPDLSQAHTAKTCAHELAHILLHHSDQRVDRAQAEVEAESVAYLVLGAHGVATDAYSFGYITSWAHGDLELIRTTAQRVLTCTNQILEDLGYEPQTRNSV